MSAFINFIFKYWKGLLIFLSVLLLLLLIVYLIMALVAYFITWWGSFLILFVVLFLISKKIATFMVFPGHCNFFKRSIEYRLGKQMASQVVGQIIEQRYALEIVCTSVADRGKISLLIETNYATCNMIKSLEYTLSRQRELGTISDDQELLHDKVQALKESFDEIKLEIGEEVKTLWELGDIENTDNDQFSSNSQTIQNIEAVKESVRLCTKFCESFHDLVPFSDTGNAAPLTLKAQIKSFLSNTSFGTIDQLRVELETTYKGVQVTLESEDGKKIDCMWIPGLVSDPSFEGHEDQFLPTMVYCSPNAFLYESFQFENEWLEFYRNLGINMFVWNYRGYGRSEGSPNPRKMFEDGEMIIDYLRNQRGVRKPIGVHGQSLGGAVACHIARNCSIDFLFVDKLNNFIELKLLFKIKISK